MQLIARLVSFVSRRTQWADGHVFAITPERIALAEGLRAAVAMAPLLVAAAVMNRSELAFAAIGVFWNCLCDPQGARAERLRSMAGFTVLGAIVLPLAAYVAHWGEEASLAMLFLLVFLCGLARSFKPALGPMPAQGGFIAQLAVVIGIASARPLLPALELAGFFLLGSIWAIVFCVFLWPIPLRRTASLTFMTIFGRLEGMAAYLQTLDAVPAAEGHNAQQWNEYDTVYRRGVRIAIERGRALAARDLGIGSDFERSIDAAGRVFSALVATGHARRGATQPLDDVSRQLLVRLRELLSVTASADGLAFLHSAAYVAQATNLLQDARQRQRLAGKGALDDAIARAVVFAATALTRLSEQRGAFGQPVDEAGHKPVQSTRASPGKSSWATATAAAAAETAARHRVDKIVWRHALRVAVAAVLAYAAGSWLSVTFAYWGALAAIIVTQPASTNTWPRILERAIGSVLGGTIAAILLTQISSSGAMALAIIPLAAAAIASRLVNYGLLVVFLTPMFMLTSDLIHPAHGLIFARFVNEALGAALAIAASFLLWPEKGNNVIQSAINDAISANMKFASAALRVHDGAALELDVLQRQAGLASARLETTRERLLLEGRWRSTRLDRLHDLIVSIRLVCGAAAVVEVLADGAASDLNRQRADGYDTLTAGLLAALAGGAAMPSVDQSTAPVDDLDQAIRNLVAGMDRFARVSSKEIGSPGLPISR